MTDQIVRFLNSLGVIAPDNQRQITKSGNRSTVATQQAYDSYLLPPRLLTEVAARLLKAATAIGPRSRPEVSVSGVRASRTPPGPLTGRIQRHAEIVDHHVRISTGAA